MIRVLAALPFFLVTMALVPAMIIVHVAYHTVHDPQFFLGALDRANAYRRVDTIFALEIQRWLEKNDVETAPQESLEQGIQELLPAVWVQATVEESVRLFYTWFLSDDSFEDVDITIDLQSQHDKFSSVVTPMVEKTVADFPPCPSVEAKLSYTCNPGSERIALAMNEIVSFVHLVVPQTLSLQELAVLLPADASEHMNARVAQARAIDRLLQKGILLLWVVTVAIAAFVLVLGASSIRSAVIWFGSLSLAASMPLFIVSFFISGEVLTRQMVVFTGTLSLEAQSVINDIIQALFQHLLYGIMVVTGILAVVGIALFIAGVLLKTESYD